MSKTVRRAKYGTCLYCRREMVAPTKDCDRAFTLDHVKAKSLGGWKRAPCCRKCNELKGDCSFDEWLWITANIQRWWKLFATNKDVRLALSNARQMLASTGRRPPF